MEALRDLVVVIMAGGAGTRFWPASTDTRPKQLLPLLGERTLLQQSFDRLQGAVPPQRVYVVTHAAYVDEIRRQLPELPHDHVLGEPERRDTAAAISWAALLVQARHGDAVMAVLTSDHVIGSTPLFLRALGQARDGARAHRALYTFGVPPTYAATGFGYLELAGDSDDEALVRVVEKPSRAVAEGFIKDPRFLWNSGMFVWCVADILAELERSAPAHLQALRPVVQGTASLADAFAGLQKISIDYAVMEKASRVRCVRARFSWADVGGFPALAEHLPTDAHGNAARGRTATHDAARNVVWCADPDELVALVGVSDLVVVRAGKRTLVAPKDRAEEIKLLVQRLDPEDQK